AVALHSVLYKLHGGIAVFTRHPDSPRIAMRRAKKRTLTVLTETAFFMPCSRERSVIQQALHRRQHGSVHVDGSVRAGRRGPELRERRAPAGRGEIRRHVAREAARGALRRAALSSFDARGASVGD